MVSEELVQDMLYTLQCAINLIECLLYPEQASAEYAAERSPTSKLISHLIHSGHSQDQAVAIALDEERKGKV